MSEKGKLKDRRVGVGWSLFEEGREEGRRIVNVRC